MTCKNFVKVFETVVVYTFASNSKIIIIQMRKRKLVYREERWIFDSSKRMEQKRNERRSHTKIISFWFPNTVTAGSEVIVALPQVLSYFKFF